MKQITSLIELRRLKILGCSWGKNSWAYSSIILVRGKDELCRVYPNGEVSFCDFDLREKFETSQRRDSNLNAALNLVCEALNLRLMSIDPPPLGTKLWVVTERLPGQRGEADYSIRCGKVEKYFSYGRGFVRDLIIGGYKASSPYRCERDPRVVYDSRVNVYHHRYSDACRDIAMRYKARADELQSASDRWMEAHVKEHANARH